MRMFSRKNRNVVGENATVRFSKVWLRLRPIVPVTGLLLLSIAALCYKFPCLGLPNQPGLDYSWKFAINAAFARGVQWGNEIVFTFGPLGFTTRPLAEGNNLAIATAVTATIRFLSLFSFLYLAYFVHKTASVARRLLLLGFALAAATATDLDSVFCFIAGAACLIHYETRRVAWLLVAVLVTSISLLIKISVGIPAFAAILGYAAFQDISKRRFAYLPSLAVAVALALSAIWLVLYGNLSGFWTYVVSLTQLSLGQSESMSLLAPNNWLYLFLSFLAFWTIPFRLRDSRVTCFYFLFTPPLYAFFKYSFGRQTPDSLAFLLNILICTSALLIVWQRRLRLETLALLLAAPFFFQLNTNAIGFKTRFAVLDVFQLTDRGLRCLRRQVWDYSKTVADLREQSRKALEPERLSPRLRAVLGRETVDIFPWEATIAAANDLNWKPRPIFQSYQAFTPYLDHLNASFLRSTAAPRFILFAHLSSTHDEHLIGIDNTYVLNDEPETLVELFNLYQPTEVEKGYTVFERSPHPLLTPKPYGSVEANWLEWISVPSVSNAFLLAALDFQYTVSGSIKKIVYKADPYFVDYELEDGRIVRHRLKLPNARRGLWVTPYLSCPANPFSGPRVKRIRFVVEGQSATDMRPSLSVKWEALHPRTNQ